MIENDLIERLRSDDRRERGEAWQNAGDAGPAVIPDLGTLAADDDYRLARAAKRALWKIVRHVGRPGAGEERAPVVAALTELLADERPVAVRREVLWMLSELADGGAAIERAAALLAHEALREDARMALERIPGDEPLAALKTAIENAPDDFKPNLAQSLRARGVEVPAVPCEKLVPTRATEVKPAGA